MLKSAFLNALNNNTKDQIATLETPRDLEELINLAICIVSRNRESYLERNHKFQDNPSNRSSFSTPVLPDPEPMQVG